MKVYVSGPMRGYLDYNFPAFYRAEDVLKQLGHDVFSPARRDADKYGPWDDGTTPHEIGRYLFDTEGDNFDIREAMAADLDYIIRHAEIVVSLPGTGRSTGYAAEAAAARSVGVPVVALTEFLESQGYDYRLSALDEALWNVRPYDNPDHKSLSPEVAEPEPQWREKPPIDFDSCTLLPRCDHSGRNVEQQVAETLAEMATIPDVPTVAQMLDRDHPGWRDDPRATMTGDELALDDPSGPSVLPGETMSVSSTGGMKGTKLARHDLIPAEGLTAVAEHFGRTANKYPPNNWRAGFEWSKSYAAMIRHAVAWWAGQDVDNDPAWGDDPASHLAAVAWHALILLTFEQIHPEFDDRYKG